MHNLSGTHLKVRKLVVEASPLWPCTEDATPEQCTFSALERDRRHI